MKLLHSLTTKKRSDLLRLGDILDEPLYGQPPGASEPVLLLAAGRRIESLLQLQRLRDAGFRVDLPMEQPASRRAAEAEADSKATGPSLISPAHDTINRRVESATRVREGIHSAARDLIERVRAGAAPDVEALVGASYALVSEASSEATTLVALTHLHQCDDYTVGHCVDVAILMVAIGRLLDLPPAELSEVAFAGLTHDVGKQRVPRAILEKPGRPTCEEFAEIRRHPEYGQEILAACPGVPESVPLVALQHHERTDGSGYPHGLTAPQIHPYSLIAAVADSFDAMTTNRPYHKGCAPRQAVLELYGLADRRLDGRA